MSASPGSSRSTTTTANTTTSSTSAANCGTGPTRPWNASVASTGGSSTTPDTSTTAPKPRAPDFRGNGGFGWHLVTTLADHTDIHLNPPGGKTLTATITIPGGTEASRD
ncbi:hypothetical protein OG500_19200 [Kitasatospora sp. NBC_01250]|uniref:hypothetical protein n=1 Tax=Kitasatospora sp. NBC_01250 TaxID=2903571 RepID=UPI002E30515E|nr:hypothetical protein [Kitasatospora sp. NBC_01250]